MTEEDAKARWCPFARVAVAVEDAQRQTFIGVAGANRGALHSKMAVPEVEDRLNPESARCIGSACMAWRWEMGVVKTHSGHSYPSRTSDGYCGLAGPPP